MVRSLVAATLESRKQAQRANDRNNDKETGGAPYYGESRRRGIRDAPLDSAYDD